MWLSLQILRTRIIYRKKIILGLLYDSLKFGRISRRPEEPKTRNSSCGIILRGIKNKVFRFQLVRPHGGTYGVVSFIEVKL